MNLREKSGARNLLFSSLRTYSMKNRQMTIESFESESFNPVKTSPKAAHATICTPQACVLMDGAGAMQRVGNESVAIQDKATSAPVGSSMEVSPSGSRYEQNMDMAGASSDVSQLKRRRTPANEQEVETRHLSVNHESSDMGDNVRDERTLNTSGKGEMEANVSCDWWALEDDEPRSLPDALSDLFMSDDSEQEVVLFHRPLQLPVQRQRNKQKPFGRPSANKIARHISLDCCVMDEKDACNFKAEPQLLKRKMATSELCFDETPAKLQRRATTTVQSATEGLKEERQTLCLSTVSDSHS